MRPTQTVLGSDKSTSQVQAQVVVEEPLTIVIQFEENSFSCGSYLRTPGNDPEMILGLLVSEGWIENETWISDLNISDQKCVEARVVLNREPLKKDQRLGLVHSGCGICGAELVEESLAVKKRVTTPFPFSFDNMKVISLNARKRQDIFQKTGGCHGAGLFDREGAFHFFAQDVGRHNAVDKVFGQKIRKGNSDDLGLWLSGRAGFELIYKALSLKSPMVCSLGAASSLAVQLAREAGITLVGYCSGEPVVYCHSHRILGG